MTDNTSISEPHLEPEIVRPETQSSFSDQSVSNYHQYQYHNQNYPYHNHQPPQSYYQQSIDEDISFSLRESPLKPPGEVFPFHFQNPVQENRPESVHSFSQIRMVPTNPSDTSLDSPTPSRYPDMSNGSSTYKRENTRGRLPSLPKEQKEGDYGYPNEDSYDEKNGYRYTENSDYYHGDGTNQSSMIHEEEGRYNNQWRNSNMGGNHYRDIPGNYHNDYHKYNNQQLKHHQVMQNTQEDSHTENDYVPAKRPLPPNPSIQKQNMSNSTSQNTGLIQPQHRRQQSTTTNSTASRTDSYITKEDFLVCINHMADTIAQKVAKQDADLGKSPSSERNSFEGPSRNDSSKWSQNITPIHNNFTFEKHLSGGSTRLPSPHFSMNESLKYKGFRMTQPSPPLSSSNHFSKQGNNNKEDEYIKLENYLLTLPQGAKILRSFYQNTAYNDSVNPENDDESPGKNGVSLKFKIAPSITHKLSSEPVLKSTPLPFKSKIQVKGRSVSMPTESAKYNRKSNVTFAESDHIIPNSRTQSSSGEPLKSLLPPIQPQVRPNEPSSFPPTPISKEKHTGTSIDDDESDNDNSSTNDDDDDVTPTRYSEPRTPPRDTVTVEDISKMEGEFRDLQGQLNDMNTELQLRDSKHEELLNENITLKQDISKCKEDINRLVKLLDEKSKKIRTLKGTGLPITQDVMPDAKKTKIPEHRKLYNRLEMTKVDKMGLIDAQNTIKNVMLQIGAPLSDLESRLKGMIEVVKGGDLYVKFANDIHVSLYHEEMNLVRDPFGEDQKRCLQTMVTSVQKLDSIARKKVKPPTIT